MKNSFFAVVTAMALAVFASQAVAGAAEVAPGRDFQAIGIELSSIGGTIVVYAGVREISAKVAVCGLVFFEKPTGTARAIEPKVTSKLIFKLAGKRLNVQTSAFRRYPSEAEALAGKARCFVTGTAWAAAYAKTPLSIELERGSISY